MSLAMVGKFMIAASFAVIYVYAGEMMPTVVRSEAMGISSFFSGFGLLIFPYLNALVSMQGWYTNETIRSQFTKPIAQVRLSLSSQQNNPKFQGKYSHVLPLVIMGTLSVIGGAIALFLPETLGQHLPNTLEEGEAFGTDFKIFSCPNLGGKT